MPDTAGLDNLESTSLRGIATRARVCKHHRFRNLYREINVDLLRRCFRELNPKAAKGVDDVTYDDYAHDLEDRLIDLVERLKHKRYRARLVRRVMIPKGNGKERPLGIPALEDKLVQRAAAKLLSAIYEQDFIQSSYGYRPQRSAKGAIEDLTFNLQYGSYGHLVEADIQGFFDHLDHDWLIKMLEQRVDDKAFLGLIRKWLKAGILDIDGQVTHPETGSPQGGIISPVLANIYLHYALDIWFERVVKPRCRGKAFLNRYADDLVCAFQYKDDAEAFYRVLPKRLNKFNLAIAPDKTRLCRFSRFHPGYKQEARIQYLGFELWWGWDRHGEPKVQRRTAPNKRQAAEQRIRDWIKKARHLPGHEFVAGLKRRLQGHYNYYGVMGNSSGVYSFYIEAIRQVFKWLNRRGGKYRSFTWPRFKRALVRLGIPKPRTKPWSQKCLVYV